jgi:hypothetical protein
MKKLLPLLLTSSLFAHDLYLMPQNFRPAPGATLLLSAHTGDSFPGSEQGVDPKRLTSIPAIDVSQWRILGMATHTTATVAPGSQYFAISTQPRHIEMEPVKFLAYLKAEGLNQPLAKSSSGTTKSRESYSKYAKAYVVAGQPTGNFAKPLGLKIEIVPLTEPAQLKAGDSLPIQLLFDGKPLADTQVEMALSANPKSKTNLAIAGRTDASGKLEIRIAEAGKIRLHAVHMLPSTQPTHDWESFWATLTFEVASGLPMQSTNLTNR